MPIRDLNGTVVACLVLAQRSADAHDCGARLPSQGVSGPRLSRVLHDVRNVLTSLTNNARHLGRLVDADGRAREKARSVTEAALLLAGLVEELSACLAEPAGHASRRPVPVDVNQLIEAALSVGLPAHRPSPRVTCVLERSLPAIIGSPHRLQRAFVNVIQNAAAAMPEGGELLVRSWAASGRVHIEFEDTGRGILREQLTELLTRPTVGRTLAHGGGLGLEICKDIVAEHKGELVVETCPGLGSKFRISLPCQPRIASEPNPRHLFTRPHPRQHEAPAPAPGLA